MGYSTQSINVESVDPVKAQQFLSYNFAHNRPPRQYRVEFLASEMAEGRFLPTAEIHIVYTNGEPQMVNGQHTCLAIIKYGKPVRVTVRKTTTSEPGQTALFYALGHDTGLVRTVADSVRAYSVEEQTGLTRSQVDALGTALRFMVLGFTKAPNNTSKGRLSPPELVEHIFEWAPYARRFFLVVGGKEKMFYRSMFKAGNLSVGLAAMRYAPNEASRFWGQMGAPDGLAWRSPVMTARRVLESSVGAPSAAKYVTPARLARQIARCWLAFLQEEEMGQIPKIFDENAAIKIAKTPWNGRQPRLWMPDAHDGDDIAIERQAVESSQGEAFAFAD